MNENDVEIILKPFKNELVAFELRVLALEVRINQIAPLIDISSHLEIRVKSLEDFLKKQIEINSAFFKIIDLLKEKETKPEKKSIWEQIKNRIVERK